LAGQDSHPLEIADFSRRTDFSELFEFYVATFGLNARPPGVVIFQ
jgi:hypothetical protein